MTGRPLILDVKGNSLDDGPGVRSVVFFKGCPLRCLWCHNPESKRPGLELSWERHKCVGCGTCVDLCPERAVHPELPDLVDRDRCTLCLACVKKCPSTALTQVGHPMATDEILRRVVRYKPFFDTSGGGVTLSGGEPTLFLEFTAELARTIKAVQIHVLLETCGWFDPDRFESLLLPHLDTVYMDLKLIDPEEHQRYCGVDNKSILDNFLRLHELARTRPFSLLPRTPLIPGITDTDENMNGLARFYAAHGVQQTALLSNNPIWFDKCRNLGVDPGFAADHPVHQLYDGEKKKALQERFHARGIQVHLS